MNLELTHNEATQLGTLLRQVVESAMKGHLELDYGSISWDMTPIADTWSRESGISYTEYLGQKSELMRTAKVITISINGASE